MKAPYASKTPEEAPDDPFRRLCWIMERLLAPDGCPWDREQTHQSLAQYLIEETYEVVDAIATEDEEDLKEELGDVALQVVFHAALAARDGRFDIDDVLRTICDKLIRRHPHVFGETLAETPREVLANWEQIKKSEKADKQRDHSLVAGVPNHLPALQKAHRLQERVTRVGFDWPSIQGALDKVREEFSELQEEIETRDRERLFHEMGDLLFALTNVARFLKIQPEEALQAANGRFIRRFRHIERRAAEKGRELKQMTLEEMDALWEESKSQEKD